MKFLRDIVVFHSVFLTVLSLFGQSVENYKRQREMLSSQIELLDKSLDEASSKKRSASERYNLLQTQIEKREKLKEAISIELSYIDSVLMSSRESVADMSSSLSRRKNELGVLLKLSLYTEIMRSRWTDVLVSPSFRDAFTRWYGLRRTREKLQEEINRLVASTSSVEDSIAYFSDLRVEHEQLMTEELSNMDELNAQYRRSRNLLGQISRQEDRIKDEIARQQQEDERLVGIIRGMLTEELADEDGGMDAAEAARYTAGFEREKQSLSWPVKGGVVTRGFGINNHPRFKNIRTDNKGIDMICPDNSDVNAVYDGMVLLVVNQPPFRTVVIINHGRFSSAYYGLSTVNVSKGQTVRSGDSIGNIAPNNGDSNFHFEIWDGNRHVNPQHWLRPRQ